MNSENKRILLNITVFPGDDDFANEMADATYYRLNNILSGDEQFVNVSKMCNECEKVNKKLSTYIRNRCFSLMKKDTVFSPEEHKVNSIFNVVENSKRKNIRILLYPGARTDISALKMNEATHNMIIQFAKDVENFIPTEVHDNPPSFYQVCSSEDVAILYSEALLVDSCMCHYLGISDVAYHHDDKKRISEAKVTFLCKYSNNEEFLKLFSYDAQKLIKHVASKLSKKIPYISFFSIFNVAPYDLVENYNPSEFPYFNDYCILWKKFQEWYFLKYKRVFYKNIEIVNPLDDVFNRNKYHGQISPSKIKKAIEEIFLNPPIFIEDKPFGIEYRFAVVVLRHTPEDSKSIAQLEALFPGEIYQSKWDIVYWGDIHKYCNKGFDFEVVPFLIEI